MPPIVKRLLLLWTLGAFAGIAVLQFNPVHNTLLKLALIACVTVAWLGSLVLTWNWRPLRFGLLVLPLLAAGCLLLPGGEIDSAELRQEYLRRVGGFEGTRYFWGGESARGIDCSGLPRRAYRDALLAYGFKHLNGSAVRASLEQWWFDTSAEALGKAYRGFTEPVEVTGTIREMDYSSLSPGDLAVTTDGVHVLVYVGDGRWSQADPGAGRVLTLNGRTDDNGWFGAPVATHRWALLSRKAR